MQCAELHTHLRENEPLAQDVELIVVSPMRRTLETAMLGLRWLLERGVSVEVKAEWQENSDKPCDTGTSNPSSLLSSIQDSYNSPQSPPVPMIPVSAFDSVDPVYPTKTGKYAFTRSAVVARGEECLNWLRKRDEKVIAVISHSGFLRTAIAHAKFANADYRIFDFVPGTDELKEWRSTEMNGGGMGKSEKGRAEIREHDFPPPAAAGMDDGREVEDDGEWDGVERDGENMEEQPRKVDEEVVGEVPRRK